MRYIPNLISFLRILLVVPTVYFLAGHQHSYALLLFFIAGLSDGLDGFLARHFGWTSRLGSFLDPMADKLLMTASYFMLGWSGHLPVWLVSVVIGRDLVIVLGALAYRYLIKDITMKPLFVSKLNTVMQIFLVLLMLFNLSGLPLSEYVPGWLTQVTIYAVLTTALLSGLSYIFIWSHRAMHAVEDNKD
ncbi:CDP-diacylglycerol--glycerol-3-phosphate 3-phosphatidyltransferase [hydrothermal vent metagenome]|uniref:CDP-diacylglycerol--glycerol-3-phosphate 3-phosphatidyltransferase n=1 Tax=hydrothermal vent metagenome TaxID=652676 RepID=A0A3B1A7Y6_9ZZZZ